MAPPLDAPDPSIDASRGGSKLPRWARDVPIPPALTHGGIETLGDQPDNANTTWAGGDADGSGGSGFNPGPIVYGYGSGFGGRKKTLAGAVVGVLALGIAAWMYLIPATPLVTPVPTEQAPTAPTEPTAPTAPTEPTAPELETDPPVPAPAPETEPETVEESPANKIDPSKPIAAQVEAVDGCEDTVYVSSLLGMEEFDKKYLSTLSREECSEKLCNDLANRGEAGIDDVFDAVRHLQIWGRIDEADEGIWARRPTFTVAFPNDGLPKGVKVSVYVDVPQEARQYLAVQKDQPISNGTGIELARSTSKDKCDFNQEQNQFELPLELRWNRDALLKLETAVSFTLNVRVHYEGDGSVDPFPVKIRVEPATQIEHGYPLAINFATLIDSDHPWVKQILDGIPHYTKWENQEIRLTGGGSSDPVDRVLSAYMIWEEIVGRGLSYHAFSGGDPDSQKVRPVDHSLATRNGNCADGSVLFASLFEVVGLDPILVCPPGHMFVMISVPGEHRVLPIETTCVGSSVSVAEFEKIALHPLLQQLVQRYRWLVKDAAFRSFASAVASGHEQFVNEIEKLEALDKQHSALADGVDKQRVRVEIERGLHLERLDDLRRLGIKPVGTPQGWGKTHKLPKRETPP